MFYPTDFLPEYMRYGFRTYQAFQQALYNGDLIREEFNPQKYYHPPYTYPMIYNAQPVQNDTVTDKDVLDFSFVNFEGIRGCYKVDTDGLVIRLVNAEDIARGAGIVMVRNDRVVTESCDTPYESIRWNTVNQYAQEALPYLEPYLDHRILAHLHFPIGKDSYIPLIIAQRIIGRCTSQKAREFQAIVDIKFNQLISKRLMIETSEFWKK